MEDTNVTFEPVVTGETDITKMNKAELLAYAQKLAAENTALAAAKPVEPEKPGMTPSQWLNERVAFKAIRDNGAYKEDIVVFVNGDRFQIQRGKMVMIPRKVLMALDDAERQMAEYAEFAQGQEERAEARFGAM